MNSIPLHPWTRAAMRKAAVVLTNLSHDKVREIDFDDIQLILETMQTLDQSFEETNVAPLHDSLRDRIGQALSDALATGAEQPDWCDSRNVDYLADAVIAALDKELK